MIAGEQDVILSWRLFEAGQLAQAAEACHRVLAANPRHADAMHILGLIAQQSGDSAAALEWIDRALKETPGRHEFHANRGAVLQALDRPGEALEAYDRAIALRPNYVEAHNNRGSILQDLQRFDEAIAAYRAALKLQPDNAEIFNNLASVFLESQQFDRAVAAYANAVRLQPSDGELQSNLAAALQRSGKTDLAIEAYRRALELAPNDDDAWEQLGRLLQERREFPQAIECCDRAIALDPRRVSAWNQKARALAEQGSLDALLPLCVKAYASGIDLVNQAGSSLAALGKIPQGLAVLQEAVAAQGDCPEAHHLLGNLLRHADHLAEARDQFMKCIALRGDDAGAHSSLGSVLVAMRSIDDAIAELSTAISLRDDVAGDHNDLGGAWAHAGQIERSIAWVDRAVELAPHKPGYGSNRLLTLHYDPRIDAASLLREHRLWNDTHAKPLARHHRPHNNDRSPQRRLRVGYVSPDFRNHPVASFIMPLLQQHDRATVEVFAYSDATRTDAVTDRLRPHVDHWYNVTDRSDQQLSDIIVEHEIDILVDLAMHSSGNRLLMFARKPAPVQVTYLAYASTTGMDAMDYRFADAYLDYPGAEQYYCEKPIALESYWCYSSDVPASAASALPALSGRGLTFGCLNNFSKVSTPCLELWARLLARLPGSRLLLHTGLGSQRQRIADLFASFNVSAQRIECLGYLPRDTYFQTYRRIDIALDPFPYCGGTTTCDALWMGVPVVTLAGKTGVGRAGVSLLSNAGLPQWIAQTTDQYISIALDWASDLPRLAQLRATLGSTMMKSPLMDAARFARQVEAGYRRMWMDWLTATAKVEQPKAI